MAELARRGVPVEVVTESPYVVLRYFFEDAWHLLRCTLPEMSSAVGQGVCNEKYTSSVVAVANGIAVPETIVYTTYPEAVAFMSKHGEIVVKPSNAAHGHGVSVGVSGDAALRHALDFAAAAA
jgi:hypothetical protein